MEWTRDTWTRTPMSYVSFPFRLRDRTLLLRCAARVMRRTFNGYPGAVLGAGRLPCCAPARAIGSERVRDQVFFPHGVAVGAQHQSRLSLLVLLAWMLDPHVSCPALTNSRHRIQSPTHFRLCHHTYNARNQHAIVNAA